jgi:hypothetical protein
MAPHWISSNEGIVEILNDGSLALISRSDIVAAVCSNCQSVLDTTEALPNSSTLAMNTLCIVPFILNESNLGKCEDHVRSAARYGTAESPRNRAEA